MCAVDDTPPTGLLVLDGLSGDFESVASLGELAHVGEDEVIEAIRSLLAHGLIEAWEHEGDPVVLVRAASPGDDDASLRSYWFTWTPDGEQAWQEGRELLDAHDEAAQQR
jgi:hypothetical protein